MKQLLLLLLCSTFTTISWTQTDNPAAQGFMAAASDQVAIEWADAVMNTMGGHQAWDETRFLRWTFFGRRTLLWDKWTGRVRIDFAESDEVYLVDVHTGTGKIWRDGAYLTETDSIAKYTARAKSIWINDSYWLVMPYKLKDTGVTLKYLGKEGAADSLTHKLQMTFEGVGDTPENKYWVIIDGKSKLVKEWVFFTKFDDATPRFSTPWADYKRYGNILLSGNRGRGQLTDIGVFKEFPDSAFESATPYQTPQ